MVFWTSFLALATLCSVNEIAKGDGVVSVLLRRFHNPYSAFENGTLCDEEFKGDNCDNWFEIRLKRYFLSYDSEPWEYYGKTNILGGDAFHFPKDGKAIGTNITNPFLFKFKGKWPGAFVIGVKNWDDDSGKPIGSIPSANSYLISEFETAMSMYIAPSKDHNSNLFVKDAVLETRVFRLFVGFSAWCEEGFYGWACDVFCKENASIGHYTCDPNTGAKRCKAGWEGSHCHKPICSPECDLSHANCPEPNKCECYRGWRGLTCEQCEAKYCSADAPKNEEDEADALKIKVDEEKGKSGTYIGAKIGGLVLVIFIVIVVYKMSVRRRRKQTSSQSQNAFY